MELPDFKLQAGLATKMLAVMEKVSHVAKAGRNTMQNYNYATEADTVAAIRGAMIEAKLAVFFSATCSEYQYEIPTRSGGNMRVLRVNLKVTWMDAESGFSRVEFFDGEGSDSGDKAIYKAITGAEKYALLKTFLIPTGDDPEKDSKAFQDKEIDKNLAEKKSLQEDEINKARESCEKLKGEIIEHIYSTTNLEHLKNYFTKIQAQGGDMSRLDGPAQKAVIEAKDAHKAELTEAFKKNQGA